jgi:hypothetical protein
MFLSTSRFSSTSPERKKKETVRNEGDGEDEGGGWGRR